MSGISNYINAKICLSSSYCQPKYEDASLIEMIEIIQNNGTVEAFTKAHQTPACKDLIAYRKLGDSNTPLSTSFRAKNWEISKYIISKLTLEQLNSKCGMSGAALEMLLWVVRDRSEEDLMKITELAEILLKRGVNPSLINNCATFLTKGAIQAAVDHLKHEPLIELLIAYGAKRIYEYEGCGRGVVRQRFKNETLYQRAKTRLKIYPKIKLLLLGWKDGVSIIEQLPRELIGEILKIFMLFGAIFPAEGISQTIFLDRKAHSEAEKWNYEARKAWRATKEKSSKCY